MNARRALIGLAMVVGVVGAAAAAEEAMRVSHRGILVVAIKPDPDVRYDTTLLAAAAAIDNLKAALDLLYEKSPASAAALETLKANGTVTIAYEPRFPDQKATMAVNRVAAFFPDFFKKDGSAKDFVTVVGRHGIKWPANELAGVVAHELVGHGIQHLKGRLDGVREIDLECEANLYQEQAYQDMGFDKASGEMVRFRRALETHWCADFRQYVVKTNAALAPLWDHRELDVKRLLAGFEDYVATLQRQGVAGSAIAAAKRLQDADFDRNIRAPAEQGSPAAQNTLGVRYRDGVGVGQDLAESAKWFRRAADQGHAQAQFNLGGLHWDGRGLAKNAAEAALWWRKAAEQGLAEAEFNLGIAHDRGEGATKDDAEAARWFAKAAVQGYVPAQAKLGDAHRLGRGVARDSENAYFWLTVAALKDEGALKTQVLAIRERVGRELTPARIAAIEARAKAWKPGASR